MKARIKRTGEIVEVSQTKPGVYIDEKHRTFYAKSLSFIHDEEIHWQDLRERAAIAAMQGLLCAPSYEADRDKLNMIATDAISIADVLIEEIKRNNHGNNYRRPCFI